MEMKSLISWHVVNYCGRIEYIGNYIS
jgi:hypothetical protein